MFVSSRINLPFKFQYISCEIRLFLGKSSLVLNVLLQKNLGFYRIFQEYINSENKNLKLNTLYDYILPHQQIQVLKRLKQVSYFYKQNALELQK